MEDDLKNKKSFLDYSQFRGKPFLGLAQLSKILFSSFKNVIEYPRIRPGPSQAEHLSKADLFPI